MGSLLEPLLIIGKKNVPSNNRAPSFISAYYSDNLIP